MSAYVEIIFDNSDERFPTGKDELILRRTIGLKKDEYSLDRKNATKGDVMNLLESAGFSRSNPYYIVPQGRVTTLTNMKDSERLNLLKEVAGTQVYEARRTESIKIMNETNNKRAKIDELLDYIRERLNELEEEKNELRDYQDKDKERRCLEYTIFTREQQEIAGALDQIEGARQTGVEGTDENREQFIENEKIMARINAQIAELKQQMDFLKVDKAQQEDERKENSKARAQVELQIKGMTDGQSAAQQSRAQREQELRTVEESIQSREEELAQITPEFDAKKAEELTIKSQLDDADASRQRLYAKQGRNSRFRNKRERDDWLTQEVSDTYMNLSTVKAVRMQTTEDITELEKEIGTLESEVEQLRGQFEGRVDAVQSLEQQVQAAKEERDKLMDQRRVLWRDEARLDTVISNAQGELDKAERSLSHMMDHNTSRGIAAVRRIQRQENLQGVYGTVAELFEVNERYRTAVEITAGNSLFHYVVDNEETATRVLERLQREKAGRITFMPLNRLKPRPANLPKASDAQPMIEKMQYDPRYEKAFQQVFGKTIICPNLQVASQYARSHGVNAITPDGDRSDKKGALSGGFHDPRQSRLEAVRNVTKWRDEYETQKAKGTQIKRDLERLEQETTKAVGQLQMAEQRKQQQHNSHGPLRQELKSKIDVLRNKKDSLEAKQRARANIETNVKSLTDQQIALEAEKATDFKKALTREEETQLENLSTTVQNLRRQYTEVSSQRSELEQRKRSIESQLNDNLQPRLDQLKTAELDTTEESSSGNIKDRQRSLKKITKALDTLSAKLAETEESIENCANNIGELETRNAEIRRQQEELAKAIERHQRRMEKSTQKKAALAKQANDCASNIRNLGILPSADATAKYERMDSNTIVKKLHKVNEALKKYSHVNKKAFEQYNNFTRQRETLTKRREELDSSQRSIEELIEVLDQRKDEAIERTFKQVSREFANVFEKLVPAGMGRLIIQRKTDQRAAAEDDEDEDEARRESVENYTGVGISVSFNSKHDDQQRIQQLSGGQKSKSKPSIYLMIYIAAAPALTFAPSRSID